MELKQNRDIFGMHGLYNLQLCVCLVDKERPWVGKTSQRNCFWRKEQVVCVKRSKNTRLIRISGLLITHLLGILEFDLSGELNTKKLLLSSLGSGRFEYMEAMKILK